MQTDRIVRPPARVFGLGAPRADRPDQGVLWPAVYAEPEVWQ
jgi:hypothetical protein